MFLFESFKQGAAVATDAALFSEYAKKVNGITPRLVALFETARKSKSGKYDGQEFVQKQLKGDFGAGKEKNKAFAKEMDELYDLHQKVFGVKPYIADGQDLRKLNWLISMNVDVGMQYFGDKGILKPELFTVKNTAVRIAFIEKMFWEGRWAQVKGDDLGKVFDRVCAEFLYVNSLLQGFVKNGVPNVGEPELDHMRKLLAGGEKKYPQFVSEMEERLGGKDSELNKKYQEAKDAFRKFGISAASIQAEGYIPKGGNIEVAIANLAAAMEKIFGDIAPIIPELPKIDFMHLKTPSIKFGQIEPSKPVDAGPAIASDRFGNEVRVDSKATEDLFFIKSNKTPLSALRKAEQEKTKVWGPDFLMHGLDGPIIAQLGGMKLTTSLKDLLSGKHSDEVNNFINNLPQNGTISLSLPGYGPQPYAFSYGSTKRELEPGGPRDDTYNASLVGGTGRMDFTLGMKTDVMQDGTKHDYGNLLFTGIGVRNSYVTGNYSLNFDPNTGKVSGGNGVLRGDVGDFSFSASAKDIGADLAGLVKWQHEHPFESQVALYGGGTASINQIRKDPGKYAWNAYRNIIGNFSPKTLLELGFSSSAMAGELAFDKEKLHHLLFQNHQYAVSLNSLEPTSYLGGDNRRVLTGTYLDNVYFGVKGKYFNSQGQDGVVLYFNLPGRSHFGMSELGGGDRRYFWTTENPDGTATTLAHVDITKFSEEQLNRYNSAVKKFGDSFNSFVRGGLGKDELRTSFWENANEVLRSVPGSSSITLSIPAIGGAINGADIRTENGTVNVGKFINSVSKGMGKEGMSDLTLTVDQLRWLVEQNAAGNFEAMADFVASRLTNYSSLNNAIQAMTISLAFVDKKNFDRAANSIADHFVVSMDNVHKMTAMDEGLGLHFKVGGPSSVFAAGLTLGRTAFSLSNTVSQQQQLFVYTNNIKFDAGFRGTLDLSVLDVEGTALITARIPYDKSLFVTGNRFNSSQEIYTGLGNKVLLSGSLSLALRKRGDAVDASAMVISTIMPDATLSNINDAGPNLKFGKPRVIHGVQLSLSTHTPEYEGPYAGIQYTRPDINTARGSVLNVNAETPSVGEFMLRGGVGVEYQLMPAGIRSFKQRLGWDARISAMPSENVTVGLYTTQGNEFGLTGRITY